MNSIGPDGTMALADALSSNESLTHLDLFGNPIGNEGGMHLASMLQINTTLESLNVGSCGLKTQALMSFCTVMRGNTTLLYLNLSDPLRAGIKDDTILHITKMIEVNNSLKRLSLAKHHFRDYEAENLSKVLGVNCKITELDLNWYENAIFTHALIQI
jgi:hypothetical protein